MSSLPAASPGAVSADYLGSRWHLITVTDGHATTAIPNSIDVWLRLAAGGNLTASDGINTISARFTRTSDGFDVRDAVTSLAGYAGTDAGQLAAVTGISAVTINPGDQPLHVTVLAADREHLDIQAGGVRLKLTRSAPAGTTRGHSLSTPSAARPSSALPEATRSTRSDARVSTGSQPPREASATAARTESSTHRLLVHEPQRGRHSFSAC